METITFKKSGNPIRLIFKVLKEKLAVVYSIELLKNRNKKSTSIYNGDDYRKLDHTYFLPVPVNENNKRILSINANYTGFETNIDKNYLMTFEAYQGDLLLSHFENSGSLSSLEENISLSFQLVMI